MSQRITSNKFRKVVPRFIALAVAASLSACGGGGGGDSAGGGGGGGGGVQPQGQPAAPADAVRMAEHASFGPTDSSVAQIQQGGLDAYLNGQFSTAATGYSELINRDVDPNSNITCPSGSPGTCYRDNYTAFPVQAKFYRNALTGADQLRQRVAFALSQITVTSDVEVEGMYATAQYQQMLLDHAFGNFRDILYNVTLSPTMGSFLNMANSGKNDPNENYARELLQLFSIGVFELNQDSSHKLDGQGNPIPTYDQDTVEGFAAAFTGWSYPPRPGQAPKFFSPRYYIGQMVPIAANHDIGAKKLLNGVTLPAGQSAQKDLNDAIDNVFNHPNVGPFIALRLIQHLVTSNPSPAYIARVAGAFNNNGQGVRGDMKAVIRAILLDSEARGETKTDPNFGKLREPALFMVSLMRVIGGVSDGVYLNARSAEMQQRVFSSPSVFNFYPPDYGLPGSDVLSPEFAITNTSSSLRRVNVVKELVMDNSNKPADTSVVGATGTNINWSSWQALAADTGQLVDKLNFLMMHNTMPSVMRGGIIAAVEAVPANDPLKRAKTAVYLVATSAQYQVEQ